MRTTTTMAYRQGKSSRRDVRPAGEVDEAGRGADEGRGHDRRRVETWRQPCGVQPDAAARHCPADDVVGHEARGLLNVIVLLSYSLRAGAATDEERRQWWAEIGAAAGRLAQLSAGPDAAHAASAPPA